MYTGSPDLVNYLSFQVQLYCQAPLNSQDQLHLMKTPSLVDSGYVHITASHSSPHAHMLTAISDLFSWKDVYFAWTGIHCVDTAI